MPIEVTCEECFTSHRVKSEHAGKRFKCRECGTALVVPRNSAISAGPVQSAPAPRSSGPSRAGTHQKKRSRQGGSRSRRKAQSSGWWSGPLRWIAGGAVLLVVVALVLLPRLLGLLAMPLALAGIALTLWGALKCLASAFEEDFACGLMWLLVPFYNVFYMFTRWDRVGPYFLTFVGGILLMWTPLYGLKLITQMQREARNYDPTTEIARDYDNSGLDQPVAAFQQPSAGNPPSRGGDRNGAGVTTGRNRADQTAATTSPRSSAAGRVRGMSGRQPPSAEVLDGRPQPVPYPPRTAKPLFAVSEAVKPGSEVWINERGWWYAGKVTQLTDQKFTVKVQFEGWEDREPSEINFALLRQRTQMSAETVRYKLKIINVNAPHENLVQRIDAKLAQAHGYVARSAEVDLENHVFTYETQRGGDLDEMKGVGFSLRSVGVETREIGVVKETTPSGELMVGQIHYKDYVGTIPLNDVADLALRGYCQYVPGSAQVDEAAGVIRFVFDPSLIEGDDTDATALSQLMQALGHFSFGQLGRPEATPYTKE